jgi:hypothetical protein
VAATVVHDDDIARLQFWHGHLIDIGLEGQAGDGPNTIGVSVALFCGPVTRAGRLFQAPNLASQAPPGHNRRSPHTRSETTLTKP